MKQLPANTLELNRKFLQVPDSAAGFDYEATLRAAYLLNRTEDWKALLTHPYVVVLGEAGTGKSTEFLLRAQSLVTQGRFAFFVEISNLATEGLRLSLNTDDEERLENWQKGQEDAVFFLDSLDEAKLQNRSLQQALRRLQRELRGQWARVRLIVSCRASDWMAEADRDEIRSVAFPGASEIHIVQLAPLNSSQAERLAQAAGVVNVSDFMTAVTDNYAQIFIERPLDVKWLGSYWVHHRRIGSLRELIADNVREKLKERPDRSSVLSLTKAEVGIETLAGVAMINNSWTFLVPDNSLDVQRAIGVVDPREFLPDWSSIEIGELLRRPVFDEATYGRVRLHHRSVQEFLAARWVQNLIKKGLSSAAVVKIFFRDENGERVIPDHLGPVVAWLALWDKKLRRLLIRESPSLLIEHGDPSGFADDERKQILQGYAKSYEGRSRRFDRFDLASLRRFSAPALFDQIKIFLKSSDTPDELTSIILKIVECGRISACADMCLTLALDHSRSGEVRYFAIQATAAIGTEAHRAALMDLLQTTSEWEQETAGAFIRGLYPDPLTVQSLVQLLMLVKPKRQNLTTSLQFVLEYEVPHIGSIILRLELLRLLLSVVWVLEAETGEYKVPTPRRWLLPLVARLVSGFLDEFPKEFDRTNDIATALGVFHWCNEHGLNVWYGLNEVKKAIARHPEAKRDLFWRRVEKQKSKTGTIPTRYFELRYSYEIFELNCDDRYWLAADARGKINVREQLLAFDTLSQIADPDKDQTRHLRYLHEVAADIPALTQRLKRMLNWLAPLPHPKAQLWKLEQQARELAREREKNKNRDELIKCINEIRNGSHSDALWFLYQRTKRDHMTFGKAAIDTLVGQFGEEITTAAIAGWRAFWRTFNPPLPHERAVRNSTPAEVIIGLLGLDLDFENGLLVSSLNSEDVRVATRYAACELNSFPSWLTLLAEAHQSVVAEVLSPCVVADLIHPNDGTLIHDVLAKLPRAAESIRVALAPSVAQQLHTQEPPMLRALGYALDVVIDRVAIPVEDFATLAGTRCRDSIEEPERFAIWWNGWLSLNSAGALEFLEQVVCEIDRKKADQLLLYICHQIHKRSQTYPPQPFYIFHDPQVLKRLIPIVYKHIRRDDDIEHEGGFSPGPRDHAQRVRSQLVSWLAEKSGTESVQALRQLADDPRLVDIHDWLLHLAGRCVVANAALVLSSVLQQLTNLCKRYGTNILTHLGELQEEDGMERFDIGIITMKEEEYDALLDKFKPNGQHRGTNRDYDVAIIETEHDSCRVAITRCVQQGNAYAQSAASEMLSDINPRFLLVVGIAGGVPTTDFCLGDVIVSNYIQDLTLEDTGTESGNVRYNALGGPLLPSAARIVERLRIFERLSPDWGSAHSICKQRPSLSGTHTTGDVEWNKTIDKALENHAQRNTPISTAQKIASSDRLIKTPELLQKWRQILKAVAAVEMESAGAYVSCQRNNVPFMAIRGISDIVGWDRNEAWTLYACHTAAAYTRMLVQNGAFADPR